MKRDGERALSDFLIKPNICIGPFCADMTIFEVLIASQGWSVKTCTYDKEIMQLDLVFSKRGKKIEVSLSTNPPHNGSSLYVASVSSKDAVLEDGRSIRDLNENEIISIFNVRLESDNIWTLDDLKSGEGFLTYSDVENRIVFFQSVFGEDNVVMIFGPS